MRRTLVSLVLAVLLAGFVVAAPVPDDSLKAVLLKAIKAHGGEEALTKYQAAQAKNKGKIAVPNLGDLEFTQEVSYMLPDKLKETLLLEIMNQKITVVTRMDGGQASIEANGQAVPITEPIKKALDDARNLLRIGRLVPLLKSKDYELSPLGEIKVEGKPAVGIQVKSKGHKDINLYFDKETNLLAKIEHRTVDGQTGKEITEERIIQEYGKPGPEGMASPRKILIKHDGAKYLEAEVLEVKFFEKLDESEFKK